ncbi:MAG: T9SS type A sorting domain-containing protein [Dysgonamonadaceae bacterium]|jgi:hypothetical protein|nr:T9SS type A sorting domain-containing protein [Dysgonamonadaceae bacterium]
MKTKLLLLFMFLSVNAFSESVFPESDAIWNIQINGIEHYYGLSGDTIINDLSYSKLYLLNDTTLNIDAKDEYVGGFRQEGKKVYFRPDEYQPYYSDKTPSVETLLYDFSKNIGDTIWHDFLIQGEWYMNDSITASIVYNIGECQQHKTYSLQQFVVNYDGDYIDHLASMMGANDTSIEGVGSNRGLFYFLYYAPMSGGISHHLACMKQGNEIKYIDNPKCNTCFCYSTAGLQESKVSLTEVQQTDGFIQITGEPTLFPCCIKLFDLTGQLILDISVSVENEYVPIRQMPSGIYLYQIQKENEVVKTGRIILK